MDNRPALSRAYRTFHTLALTLTTGYTFYFISERMFWSFFRPQDSPGDAVITLAVYTLMAYLTLVTIRSFRVRSLPALFLAGAIYGWVGEGIVVDTAYGSPEGPFPLSISFTGLAWHALITVVWAGVCLRRSLSGPLRQAAVYACGTGIFWGFWGIFWQLEPNTDFPTSISAFALHTFSFSLPWIIAQRLSGHIDADAFQPCRKAKIFLTVLVALFFLGVRVPATPRAVLILPPLLAASFWGLSRNRARESRPDLIHDLTAPVGLRACACLLLTPLTAISVYALMVEAGWIFPTNLAVYVVTTLLGFYFFFSSLWHFVRYPRGGEAEG